MHASPARRATTSRLSTLLFAALTLSFAACADAPTDSDSSPLAGLTAASVSDSAGNAPPLGTTGPGTFHGTVLGPSPVGSGGDTLATAPRVVGARVAAFPFLGMSGETPQLGPEEAAVVTDANGRFELPQLAGGEYVVTITPPAASIYGGVWSTATAHPTSNEHPWWVVLWVK